MRKVIFIFIPILMQSCNYGIDKEPGPLPSTSIADSKDDSVFLQEYKPELPYLRIEGKDYKIREVWVEHPHLERNEGHIPIKEGYDFVMTFEHYPNDTINFKGYTKDLATGNWKIWFFLSIKEYINDTLVIFYREKLNSKEQKPFLLFKRKD